MRRFAMAFLATLLAYLVQVCVTPYLNVGGITPSVVMVNIAVLTVSYGKKFAFGAGALSGILIETMCASVPMINVIFYPVASLICGQMFADMNERRREWRRMHQKRHTDLPVFLRILGGAAAQAILLEMVMTFYLYLNGVPPTWHLLARSLLAIAYTAAATVALMYPERWLLGMYKRRRKGNVLYTAGSEQTQYFARTNARRFAGNAREEDEERQTSEPGDAPEAPEGEQASPENVDGKEEETDGREREVTE